LVAGVNPDSAPTISQIDGGSGTGAGAICADTRYLVVVVPLTVSVLKLIGTVCPPPTHTEIPGTKESKLKTPNSVLNIRFNVTDP
jgi:hypothetical protein